MALLAAASVAGSAKRTQAPTLDVTARGLEELGNAYNDVLLPLDEAARIAPNDREQRLFFKRLAHSLPRGIGRRRSLQGRRSGRRIGREGDIQLTGCWPS
ncbi:DUF927 domain-containing protein [Chelatococcus asaccharovorans]|uniref:DUF927 domain-containing protein n=1 Tax=Chelatococcus asaccharovorans TaxID=28210 RepID=UPI00397651EE